MSVALAMALVACTGESAETSLPSSSTPSASTPFVETDAAAVTAEPLPTLQPQAGAAENQAFFDVAAATTTAVDGRSYIDALAGSGFDKTQMEVTFDRTHVDLDVDTIHFSVRFNNECLIGQDGPASGGYRSVVAPLLASGTCLVGVTRQIDW